MREKQVKPKSISVSRKATAGTEKKAERKTAKKTKENEAAKKPRQAKIKLVSTEELASFVGVSVRRIQQLTHEGIIKKEPGTEKYDFVRNVHSLLQYYRKKADSRKSGESEEMAAEKLKQITAKRKLEELKLKQIEGELYKAGDIEKVMGAVLSRLRINLLAIPMGVAPALRDETDINAISEIINRRICRALNEAVDLDMKKLLEEENPAAGDAV